MKENREALIDMEHDEKPPQIFPSSTSKALKDMLPVAAMERVMHLELPVIAVLGEKKMPMEEVLNLTKGALIPFKKHNGEPLDLFVNNCRIGYGKAIKIGQRFGIYIGEIGSPEEMIKKLV